MDLSDLIDPEFILVNMKAGDKLGVLKELVGLLASRGVVTDAEAMVAHLLERESMGSTSLGRGVAFPHSQAAVVRQPAVAVGVSPSGIEFGSFDGQPVFVFFLLVAPENCAAEQLKNMSLLSGYLRENDCARKIKNASSPAEVMQILGARKPS